MHTDHVQNCTICGKKGIFGTMCKKCANSSFAHFENQLIDAAGSVVDDADVSNNVAAM